MTRQRGKRRRLLLDALEPRQMLAGDTVPIQVRAAGQTGEETMELRIDGVAVKEWQNVGGDAENGAFLNFNYHAPAGTTIDQIQVAFTNDLYIEEQEIDRNLRVDRVSVDSVAYETEDPSVFSTGTYVDGGVTPGFRQSEWLHIDGHFQYDTVPLFPGVVAIQNNSVEVDENGGQVSFILRRTGGTDGLISVDWETFEGTALDVSDFVSTSSSVFFPDGVTGRRVFLNIVDDGVGEGQEEFSFVIDNPSSGVTLGAPRTGIVTINDDDAILPDYPNFIDPSGMEFNGFARAKFGAVVLTNNNPSLVGSSFFDTTLPIEDETSFQTEFTFRITGGPGADGIALVIHGDPAGPNAIAPTPGSSIGYVGIQNSIAIEFDTYETDDDINDNHIEVVVAGNPVPLIVAAVPENLNGGTALRAWVDYNGISQQLSVYVGTGVKPSLPLLTTLVDVSAIVGPQPYAGFTSATGAFFNAHRILSWQMNLDKPEINPLIDPLGDPTAETVIDNLIQPMSIDWTPDGELMYIAEKSGIIRVVDDGELQTAAFVDLSDHVNDTRDRGLLDIVVHPDFPTQPYVYATYTYDPPEVLQNIGHPLAGPDQKGNRAGRIVRLEADATNDYLTIVPGSETVLVGGNSTWANFNAFVNSTEDFSAPPAGILADGSNLQDFINSDSESHTVGGLVFDASGALYASIGDGASYNAVDLRAARVQDIDNLSGKVLRIDPLTGLGLADNPFYDELDPAANRSKVFQLGMRNPFRIATDANDQLYVGDVGWTRWEEINVGLPGENFGWPWYEGATDVSLETLGYRDTAEAQAFYASDPAVSSATLALNHVTDGIAAIVMGDVYDGSLYDQSYAGDVFFNELSDGTVHNVKFDAQGNVVAVNTFAEGAQFVVKIKQGPDDALWFVDLDDGIVGRWEF